MTALPSHRATLLLASTLIACTGAELEPKAPTPAPVATAPATMPAASPPQTFAVAPDLAFRDPDRRKKLEAAFPKIDEIAKEELARQGLPSIALGVIIDGELAYSDGVGFADLETKRKPDADTVYRIGSMTKSFTAFALLSLRDEGALSLDDTLAKWIPGASGLVYPTHDSPPITLRDLLTHTSGLPRLGPIHADDTKNAPTEEALEKSLAGLALANPPGTVFSYSNLGFGLLGVVASRAAHAPYREVVTKRVLAPLGMTSSFWDRADVPRDRLATAYAPGPDGKDRAVDHWLLGAQEGAGGLYSTIRDMSKYVAYQLSAYPPRDAADAGPLKRSSLREAHFRALRAGRDDESLKVTLADAPAKGESLVRASSVRYGYGWVAEQTCDFDELVWHNGGVDGYRSEMAFLPEQGVGVVVLTNSLGGAPEPIAERSLLALLHTGGLDKRRTPQAVSPEMDAAMKRLLAVYNQWDDAGYAAMLTGGRNVTPEQEKRELAGYKKLHGACSGYSLQEVRSPTSATFALSCERGKLQMNLDLSAVDHKIDGFAGRSQGVAVAPELQKIGDAIASLVNKWDDASFKKHLAKAKRTRDEAAKYFAGLRDAHGTCKVASMNHFIFDTTLVLECERGGDLGLRVDVDEKDRESARSYSLRSLATGTCPVR